MQRVSVLMVPQLPPQQQNSTILQLLTIYSLPAAGYRSSGYFPSLLFQFDDVGRCVVRQAEMFGMLLGISSKQCLC
jgi:hypothetical protein